MPGDTQAAGASQVALDNELVPLAVASSVTYFHLTEVTRQVDTHENLHEMLNVVAVALSQVAPIYRSPGQGDKPPLLSNREVDDLLFKPIRDGEPTATLDGLCIRRGDLRKALVTLREARSLFGPTK
jgi:hypothetical protein